MFDSQQTIAMICIQKFKLLIDGVSMMKVGQRFRGSLDHASITTIILIYTILWFINEIVGNTDVIQDKIRRGDIVKDCTLGE